MLNVGFNQCPYILESIVLDPVPSLFYECLIMKNKESISGFNSIIENILYGETGNWYLNPEVE